MTKIERLEIAMLEARKFIKCAAAWKKHLKDNGEIRTSKEGGACKRASMDLTRALTKVRMP